MSARTQGRSERRADRRADQVSNRVASMVATGPVTVVPRKRRNVELAMMLLAGVIGLGGYVIVHLNVIGTLPSHLPVVAGVWAGLLIITHVVVRWKLPYADPLLLPCVFALNGLGLTMIDRIDLINSPVTNGAATQLLWTVLGVALFVAAIFVIGDHRPLQQFTYTLALAGIVLLLLPLVPGLGIELGGARIWIRVAGLSFQPAEVAKIVLSIAFASYLVEKRDVLALAGLRIGGLDLPRARDLGPILVMWGASLVVLVAENDLGTSLLFFGLFVMLLYVSTERPGWAVLGTVLFAAGAYAGYLLFGHVRIRVGAWLHPFSDPSQYYQIISAQYGFAYGGILGTGLGEGRPGLTPLARSDFIAAAIGEELGMTGLMAVILIYGLIVARGLRTALACREPFGKLLAAGLSFAFALQVFVIIGGVTRLLPLTGLTTPFMSQGGSSMISNWVVIGLLMLISHSVRKPLVTVPDYHVTGYDPTPSDTEDEPDSETTQIVSAQPVSRAWSGGAR